MPTLTLTLHRTLTLAVAILLSWVTATDQRVYRLVASVLRLPVAHGADPVKSVPPPVRESVPPATSPSARESEPESARDAIRPAPTAATAHDTRLATLGVSGDQQQRLQQLGHRLRSLGATYLLLERWRQPADDLCYRVRCDLSSAQAAVHCSFEATRHTPVAAMEEVLEAVQRVNGGQNDAPTAISPHAPSGNRPSPPVRHQFPAERASP
jgi:hypothetical protein